MKKKSLFFVFVCILFTHLHAQQKYKIEGVVSPTPKDQTIHLYYQLPSKGSVHDTCRVVNGKFYFKGDMPRPILGFLVVLPDGQSLKSYMQEHVMLPQNQIGIYLENGNINIKINGNDISDVKVSGTPNNVAVQDARPLIWKYKKEEELLSDKLKIAGDDSIKRNSIVAEYNSMSSRRAVDVGKYIKTHPNALTSLDLLRRWVDPSKYTKEGSVYFKYLSDSLRNSNYGRGYESALTSASKVDINSIAPNFNLKDTSGNIHSLEEFKGKYVLLDFWASWCGPCLQEMPAVREAYQANKDKNFTIVGISLDGGQKDSKDKWINSFKQHNMDWIQLSDLEGWNSPIAKQYMVSSIPMNFLLDPTGKIIAKDLRGDALNVFLKKNLN